MFLSFSKYLILLSLLIAIIIGGFFLFKSKNENSFPNFSGGTYVGVISGLGPDSLDEYPFYVEKFDKSNNLLVVIFSAKWRPQVISLKPNSLLGDYSSIINSFSPISLSNGENSFQLYGNKTRNSLTGEVISSSGEKGHWTLEEINSDKIKLSPNPEFDLKSWLALKVKHQKLSTEINSILSNLQLQENKFQKISKLVDEDGQVLKEKSKNKRDSLSSEINKVAEERKQLTQQTNQSLSDLSLLSRMKKRGQAVELARRISAKENDWFNISWGNIANPAVLEEQLAEQENIDLEKLNEKYKKVLEVEQLNQNILDEESKIATLERQLAEDIHPINDNQDLVPAGTEDPNPPLPKAKTPKKEEKSNDWWNILE